MVDRLDTEAVAKYWYTEQRGRVVGNTRDWDSLSVNQRQNIIEDVEDVLRQMKEAWSWPASKSIASRSEGPSAVTKERIGPTSSVRSARSSNSLSTAGSSHA